MIIETLQIYAFGKLRDTTIHLKPGINVIEGMNEAGKSTVMAFIRAIFFGFEANRTPHLRYEPIYGGVFGGAIDIKTINHEQIRIERVFNKKVMGDVKVYLPDGRTLGEEGLKQLIGKMNEKIFKQIFTFGLTELQQIEALQDHEINGFIYNTTIGVANQIVTMKQELQKKRQSLFKASGKNPTINRTLQELDRTKQQIDTIKRKNEKHYPSVQTIKQLEQSIDQLERTIYAKNKDLEWIEKVLHYQKSAEKIRAINLQLENDFSNVPVFPENGIQRLEGIEEKLKEGVAELEELRFKKQKLETELQAIQKNTHLSPILTRIELVKDNWRLYQQHDEALNEKKREIDLIQKKIKDQIHELGEYYSEDKIRKMELSINDKQIAQVIIKEMDSKQEQLKATHHQLAIIQRQWRELEEVLQGGHQGRFDDPKEFKEATRFIEEKWEEIKENVRLKNLLSVKNEGLQQQISNYKDRKINPFVFYGFSVILFTFGLYSLLNQDWLNGGLVLSLSFGLSMTAFQSQSKEKKWIKEQISYSKKEEQSIRDIEEKINSIQTSVLPILKELGFDQLDQNTIDRLIKLKEKVQKKSDQYEVKKQKKIELDYLLQTKRMQEESYHQESEKWIKWLNQHHLDERTEPSILLSLITKIEQIKHQLEQQDFLFEQKAALENKKIQYHQELIDLLSIAQIEMSGSYEMKLERLITEKNQFLEVEEKEAHIKDQLFNIMGQMKMIEVKVETENKNREALFRYTNVTNKEEFFLQQKRYLEFVRLQEEKKVILFSMKSSCRTNEEFERLKLEIEDDPKLLLQKKEQLTAKILKLNQDLKDQSEAKGQLLNQVAELEGDQSLSHLLQEYAELQTILIEQTKEWMKLTLADHVMDNTMEIYETEKQPKVIQNATTYFKLMTDDQYDKILAPIGEKQIEVVRKDGQRFNPLFLSRGTIEQLFLSMRFALIKEFSKESLVPVVLDDIFVNFDPKRLKNSINTINQFAKEYQVLVFTCHPHVTSLIHKTIEKDHYHYYSLTS